ncbi:MAG: FxsA family protein [Dongiaceae bacterium]
MARQSGRWRQNRPGNGSRRQAGGQSGGPQPQLTMRRLGCLPGLVSVLFILLVVLEIAGFVWVADQIGLGLTLLAVLGSAFLGLWLIKRTGLDLIAKLRLAMAQGQEPGHTLTEGVCFVVAGLLLILPGFFSDIAAGILMLPMTRNWIIRRLARKFTVEQHYGTVRTAATVIDDAEVHEIRDAGTIQGEPANKNEPGEGVSEVSEPAGSRQEAGRQEGGRQGEIIVPPDAPSPETRPPAKPPLPGEPKRPIIEIDDSET